MSTMSRSPIPRETWQPPAELRRAVPREVRLSAAGKLVAGIAVALLLAALLDGPWLYVAASRDAARFKWLESQSLPTSAEVVSLGNTHGKDRRRTITYQYSFQCQTYTGRAELRREEWRKLQAGARIPVRFVPASPGTSWLPGHEPEGVPMWTAAVFPPCEILAALLLARGLRKQRAMLENGRAARAWVTRCERAHKGEHRVQRVHYEFKVLSGALRTGHYDVQRHPPEVGSALTVLYDPDEPQRSARYPLSLVRTGA